MSITHQNALIALVGQLKRVDPPAAKLAKRKSNTLTVGDFHALSGEIVICTAAGARAQSLKPSSAPKRARNYSHRPPRVGGSVIGLSSVRDLGTEFDDDLLSRAVRVCELIVTYAPELSDVVTMKPFDSMSVQNALADFYQPICANLPCDFSMSALADDPYTLYHNIPVALQGMHQWDHHEVSNYYPLLRVVCGWFDAVYMTFMDTDHIADASGEQLKPNRNRAMLLREHGIDVPRHTVAFDLDTWVENIAGDDEDLLNLAVLIRWVKGSTGYWLTDYNRQHMHEAYYYGPVNDWDWSLENVHRLEELWADCKEFVEVSCKLAEDSRKSKDLSDKLHGTLRSIADSMRESQTEPPTSIRWELCRNRHAHMMAIETDLWGPDDWYEIHSEFSENYAILAAEGHMIVEAYE